MPVYGQLNLKNISSSDQRIFYLDLPNSIEIVGYSKTSRIKLSSTNSEIIRYYGTQEYRLTPYKLGIDTVTVEINGTIELTKIFEVKEINAFYCRIGENRTNHLKPIEIVKKPFLNLSSPKTLYKPKFEIDSYRLKVEDSNSSYLLYEPIPFGTKDTTYREKIDGTMEMIIYERTEDFLRNWGNELSLYQIQRIQNLRPNSKLIFTDIKVKCENSKGKKVEDLIIFIE